MIINFYEKGEGAAYRGRVLLQLKTEEVGKSGLQVEPIASSDIIDVQVTDKITHQKSFCGILLWTSAQEKHIWHI